MVNGESAACPGLMVSVTSASSVLVRAAVSPKTVACKGKLNPATTVGVLFRSGGSIARLRCLKPIESPISWDLKNIYRDLDMFHNSYKEAQTLQMTRLVNFYSD